MFIDIKEEENSWEIEAKYRLVGSLGKWVSHFEKILEVEPKIIDKEDIYYRINDFFFRIRKEGASYTCNFKEKSIQEGLEFNFEKETILCDISFWNLFLKKVKAEIIYKKTKKGFSYFKSPFLLELVEIEPIGLFAEIEYQGKKKSLTNIKKEFDIFIHTLGISPFSLEEKSYKDLLLNIT